MPRSSSALLSQAPDSTFILTDDGITLAEFQIVSQMFEIVLVRLYVNTVREICDIEAFLSKMSHDCWIEVIVIGCDMESRWQPTNIIIRPLVCSAQVCRAFLGSSKGVPVEPEEARTGWWLGIGGHYRTVSLLTVIFLCPPVTESP